MKLLAQQRELQAKIPDIEKCLGIVANSLASRYWHIYSRACIEDSDLVCLWLEANLILDYSCEEARSLLQKNLENAKATLGVLVGDLQFLTDQVTVTKVQASRVYNPVVHHFRDQAAVGASSPGKETRKRILACLRRR